MGISRRTVLTPIGPAAWHALDVPRAILAPALAALLVLAACGSDDTSAESSTAQAQTASAAETTQARPSAADGVKLLRVGRFDSPVYVTAPPGDTRRVFVVEQGGTIRVVRAGKRLSRPFLDLRSKVISGGEQGLLSMAFAPDYARTRRFYVNYTDRSGTQSVVEFRRSKASRDRALTRGRLVLRYDGVESTTTAAWSPSGPTGCCTSARATAAAPMTSTARAATRRISAACSASCCASTRAPRAAAPTACRPATRS
jgi:glucose/arabinose dehydrogenase